MELKVIKDTRRGDNEENGDDGIENGRRELTCKFRDRCKFWKMGNCRYYHPHEHVNDRVSETGKTGSGEKMNEKNGDDEADNRRREIPCNFRDSCKFWKIGKCRYYHSQEYAKSTTSQMEEIGNRVKKMMNRTERETGVKDNCCEEKLCDATSDVNGKDSCKFGKFCRDLKKDTCTLDHTCKKEECELGNRCEYIHEKQQSSPTSSRARRLKKDILCRFLKNCREGKNCEYFHPKTTKNNENQKNWQEEMYMNVHFLTEQMKKVTKDLKKIKTSQKQREQDEENLEKMLSKDSKSC